MNLILVDYGTLDAKSCYIPYTTMPHLNTLLIAECIVQVIEAILIYRSDISIEQFHIIGFSLGAQISGQLTNFPGILNITYPRMTGTMDKIPRNLNRATSNATSQLKESIQLDLDSSIYSPLRSTRWT